jgi:TRAP-type mannitol/chloroaromatic compound transport system permease small subunit
MLVGSISSLEYAIETNEKRFSMWNPSVIPIKALLTLCLVLMLLQAFSLVFKHIATLRGERL